VLFRPVRVGSSHRPSVLATVSIATAVALSLSAPPGRAAPSEDAVGHAVGDAIDTGARAGSLRGGPDVRSRPDGILHGEQTTSIHLPALDLEPAPAAREAEAATERDRMWERLARCASGGNWSINTGNGRYGGLQFSLSSWQWAGGSGYPHRATRAEQIRRAEILLARQGWSPWPVCAHQLGSR
jgi:hypothetical protein